MKINLLNPKLNVDPERITELSRLEFFKIFFRLLYTKVGKTLSDNEINVLSVLCSDLPIEESGITKNNLPPVIKKLNQKGLMDGKNLSEVTKSYNEKMKGTIQILFNFKIV